MTPTRSTASAMARDLVAHELNGAEGPPAIGAALQGLCTRVAENLRRSVGDDGYNALVARALSRTQAEHPALIAIRRLDETDIYLDGVAASVDTHGVPAVRGAIEALLAAIADVLSGLIGADMVLNLLSDGRPGTLAPTQGTAP